ncbi:hypothetical protein F4824DRAFT_515380 [Ustulina deusta]|nr:hypothetical protein F4824DRAFT_515380 [Ustulina deusta]
MSYFTQPVTLVLNQVDAQLDGTTQVVKIPMTTFNMLDRDDQITVIRAVSATLRYPVDFYMDRRNDQRVYIANIAVINLQWSCHPLVLPGFPLPVLFDTPIPQPEEMNVPLPGVQQSHPQPPPQAPQPLTPATLQPPPQAPQSSTPATPQPPPQVPQPSTPATPQPDVKTGLKRARESETPKATPEPSSASGPAQKKKKKTKNPNPKSLNSFFLYRQQQCGTVAKEQPGILNGDISKTLAARWKAMTPEKKEPWETRAAELRAQRLAAIASQEQGKEQQSNQEQGEEQQSNQEPAQRADENHGMNQQIHPQDPQVYQTGPPSSEDSVQLPVFNTPQNIPPQAHQSGPLPLSSLPSAPSSSTYTPSKYSVQSPALNTPQNISPQAYQSSPLPLSSMSSASSSSTYTPSKHPAQSPALNTPQNISLQAHKRDPLPLSSLSSASSSAIYNTPSEYSVQSPVLNTPQNVRFQAHQKDPFPLSSLPSASTSSTYTPSKYSVQSPAINTPQNISPQAYQNSPFLLNSLPSASSFTTYTSSKYSAQSPVLNTPQKIRFQAHQRGSLSLDSQSSVPSASAYYTPHENSVLAPSYLPLDSPRENQFAQPQPTQTPEAHDPFFPQYPQQLPTENTMETFGQSSNSLKPEPTTPSIRENMARLLEENTLATEPLLEDNGNRFYTKLAMDDVWNSEFLDFADSPEASD